MKVVVETLIVLFFYEMLIQSRRVDVLWWVKSNSTVLKLLWKKSEKRPVTLLVTGLFWFLISINMKCEAVLIRRDYNLQLYPDYI